MKANRFTQHKNDRAEVGVGTLIVFIAMVLVAAVAAAVLINTTGTLQQRAQSTGKEATQEVSSNLKVLNVYGIRNSSSTASLWDININVELAAGATSLDVSKLIIRFSDGTSTYNLAHAAAALGNNAAAASTYNATWVRGNGGSTFVMQSGDLVTFHFNNANLAPRAASYVTLIPEVGSQVVSDFKTPATYGTDVQLTLR
jgi:flagellin FlaB